MVIMHHTAEKSKVYTVNDLIEKLMEYKKAGKGDYKMIWGAINTCTGYPIMNVIVKDKYKEVCV